jgi:hypothetical protein
MRQHHEQQIFPLMRRRWLFSGSENFVLYDFFAGHGVNEDVIAFSNRYGEERALIAYHNRFGETSGWVRTSTGKRIKLGGEETTVHPTLGEALAFPGGDRHFLRFRDFRTGLEYLRSARELHDCGLFLHFQPYQYYAFLDFREIDDSDGSWGWLCHTLGGRPVPSLDYEWKKIRHAPLIETFRQAVLPGLLTALGEAMTLPAGRWRQDPVCRTFTRQAENFYRALREEAGLPPLPAGAENLCDDLTTLRRLAARKGRTGDEKAALLALRQALPIAAGAGGERKREFTQVYLPCIILCRVAAWPEVSAARLGAWLDDFLLNATLREVLQAAEAPHPLSEAEAGGETMLVQLLISVPAAGGDFLARLGTLLGTSSTKTYLGCNDFGGTRWFNRERLETLLYWLFFTDAVAAARLPLTEQPLRLAALHREWRQVLTAAEESGYRFESFLATVRQFRSPTSGKKEK